MFLLWLGMLDHWLKKTIQGRGVSQPYHTHGSSLDFQPYHSICQPITSISCLILAGRAQLGQFLSEASELQLPGALNIMQSREGTTVACGLLQ